VFINDKIIRYTSFSLFGIILFLIFSITGCASGPKISAKQDWYALLPEKAMAYIYLRLSPPTKEIVKELADTFLSSIQTSSASGADTAGTVPSLEPLFERMENLALAFEKRADGQSLVYGIIEGRFPKSILTHILRNDDSWQEKQGSYPYWESAELKLQVFLASSNTIFFSNGQIEALFKRYKEFPRTDNLENPMLRKLHEQDVQGVGPVNVNKEDTEQTGNADTNGKQTNQSVSKNEIIVYFPTFGEQNLEQGVSQAMGVNMPLNQLLISADRHAEEYVFQTNLEFREEKDTHGFNNLLRLFFIYLMRKGDISGLLPRLKELDITQEGIYIQAKGLRLSNVELSKILHKLVISNFLENREKAENDMRS
jgi:hypothetical protein